MKSPAFQFYPSEFLADENVVLMSNREAGCYIKLLCYCWREGSIPSEIPKIARLCGEDALSMAELWIAISPCFTPAKTELGRLVNPRLDEERVKQEDHRKERAEAGAKGAKARWDKQSVASTENGLANGSATQQPIANDGSSSSVSSSPSTSRERHDDEEEEGD